MDFFLVRGVSELAPMKFNSELLFSELIDEIHLGVIS